MSTVADPVADPYAQFYDPDLLARLEAEGPWSLARGVEAERLRREGVIDERTMIPAGLVPEWLVGAPPEDVRARPSARIPPGRLRHGQSLNEGDPHG